MKSFKKYLTLCLIILLTITVFGCGSKEDQEVEAIPKVKKIPVETVEVKQDTFTKAIVLSGTTEPRASITVMPKVAGAEKITALNIEVGDRVKAGETIAVLDQSSVAIQLNLAQITYDDTLANYERNKVLYEAGAIPKTALDQIEVGLNQAKNNLAVQQLAYSNTIIKAPISGVVTAVTVEEGALASAQTPIATIVDIDTLEVNTSINEMQVNKVKEGEQVAVMVPSAGEEIFQGKIKSISATMDQRIKAYPMVVSIANKENKIKAGMFAELEIVTDVHKDALTIPAQAVITRDREHKVYIVEDEKAVMKMVEVGLSNGEETEILKGLNKGDKVITKGNEDVVDGDLVTVIKRGEK